MRSRCSPPLPVVAMVAAMGLYLREETDEFERAVNVEGALWATGGILAVTTMWGFAELLAGAPRLPLWLLFPAWAVMFSFGVMISRRALPLKNTVRDLRAARGWSQGDLGEQLGVSRQSVNAIETGKLRPQPAPGLQDRPPVRQADRGYLPRGLGGG